MRFSIIRLLKERRVRRAFEPLRVKLQAELSSFLKQRCTLVPARGKGGYDRLYDVEVGGQRLAIMRVKNRETDTALSGVANDLRRALTADERLEHEWHAYTVLSARHLSPKPLWRTAEAIVSSYAPFPRASEMLRADGQKIWVLLPHLFALVREMHAAKVVHMDLNLGNILVEPATNRAMAIDFEYAPAEALTFEQACLCDYLRVVNDLLRPRRGGREIQKERGRFIGLLQRELSGIGPEATFSQFQRSFPNIMRDEQVRRALESMLASPVI